MEAVPYSLTVLVTAVLGAPLLLFLYFALRPRGFKEFKHLPGPKPHWLLGNLTELRKKGYPHKHAEWVQRYGRIFKYYMGHAEFAVVAEPELVKDVCVRQFKTFHDRPMPPFVAMPGLVFGKGAFWASVRAAVLPLFHTDRLRAYGGIMHNAASALLRRLQVAGPAKTVDILNWAQAMTLDVIGTAAFGLQFRMQEEGGKTQLMDVLAEGMRRTAEPRMSNVIALLCGPSVSLICRKVLEAVPGTNEYDAWQRVKYLGQESLAIVRERRADPEVERYNDYLTFLSKVQLKDTGRPLGDRQLAALVNEFIIAGNDTTANTIAFAIYLVGRHPEVEARILDEIRGLEAKKKGQQQQQQQQQGGQNGTATGDMTGHVNGAANGVNGRPNEGCAAWPSFDELDDFHYMQQVVQETLRLYPTGAAISRRALEATMVGSLAVPKGAVILVPVYGMHHDPSLFPDPEEFRPERFEPGCKEMLARHQYAYIPFGAGPRMCIGYKFAMEEAKLALIRLYQRFSFELDEALMGPPEKPLEIETGIVMKPKHGVFVKAHPR